MHVLEFKYQDLWEYIVFSILSLLLVIFCLFVLYYIIQDWRRKAIDIPLRVTAIQIIIATCIMHLALIIWFSIKLIKPTSDLFCQIILILIFAPYYIIPSLLTTYLWIVKFILSKKDYFQSKPVLTYSLIFIINWILPFSCWTLSIYILGNYSFEDNYCRKDSQAAHICFEVYLMLVIAIGLTGGFLIQLNWTYNQFIYETQKQVVIYMIVCGGYSLVSLCRFISESLLRVYKLQDTIIWRIYLNLDNVNIYIFPVIYYFVFCFVWKKKTRKEIPDVKEVNPFDSGDNSKFLDQQKE